MKIKKPFAFRSTYKGILGQLKKWRIPLPSKPATIDINDIKLTVNTRELTGVDYYDPKFFEETTGKLYQLIHETLRPQTFIDIGANYGLMSCIMAKVNSSINIIAIEPDKRLIPYLDKNISRVAPYYKIYNAACGAQYEKSTSFALNPNQSGDNRVNAPNKSWKTVVIPTTTICNVIVDSYIPIFIKTDTQGFEESVITGGADFLLSNTNWVMMMEFSPRHLSAQGTNVGEFFKYLVTNFEVAELPKTIPYKVSTLNSLFLNPLNEDDTWRFIKHISKYNINSTGFCDILIRPKT